LAYKTGEGQKDTTTPKLGAHFEGVTDSSPIESARMSWNMSGAKMGEEKDYALV
jgi:hypothetical protein